MTRDVTKQPLSWRHVMVWVVIPLTVWVITLAVLVAALLA